MKVVGTFKHADGAFEAVDTLSQADVYATIAGTEQRGYEVLVRESQFEVAKGALSLPPANTEGTAADVGGPR